MNEEKLLSCPFCGEVPVEGYRLGADWHKCESGEVYISCSSPKHEEMCLLVYGESFEQAAEKWNRRTPLPDNKALTVEELREMDGEPVWVVCLYPKGQFWHKDQWVICGISLAKEVLINLEDTVLIEVDYGSGWLAYRRPPEKGE